MGNEYVRRKIRKLRKSQRFSQSEFGAIFGYDQRTVSYWETNVPPDYDILKSISDKFGKPISWFFEDENEETIEKDTISSDSQVIGKKDSSNLSINLNDIQESQPKVCSDSNFRGEKIVPGQDIIEPIEKATIESSMVKERMISMETEMKQFFSALLEEQKKQTKILEKILIKQEEQEKRDISQKEEISEIKKNILQLGLLETEEELDALEETERDQGRNAA